jgi:hypothetical protein
MKKKKKRKNTTKMKLMGMKRRIKVMILKIK